MSCASVAPVVSPGHRIGLRSASGLSQYDAAENECGTRSCTRSEPFVQDDKRSNPREYGLERKNKGGVRGREKLLGPGLNRERRRSTE